MSSDVFYQINSLMYMSLLFVKVFPSDPYLAPCFLSSLSMAYSFTSLRQELICMLTIQR